MNSQIDLQQPVVDSGIRSINFFNGRLLSAADLTREQSAYREADRRLGAAIGEGVAYGLEVSKAANFQKDKPAVSIEGGLAINRRGQTLKLIARTDVALVRSVKRQPGFTRLQRLSAPANGCVCRQARGLSPDDRAGANRRRARCHQCTESRDRFLQHRHHRRHRAIPSDPNRFGTYLCRSAGCGSSAQLWLPTSVSESMTQTDLSRTRLGRQ